MTKLNIRLKGDKILRQKAEPIKNPQKKDIQKLAQNMTKTMNQENGIGLAAPQVGLSKRLICVKNKDGDLILINPKITKKSWLKNMAEEGCLSIPGVFGPVKRHKSIIVKAKNLKNKSIKFKAKGLLARVIQHEVDHLNGILFIDKIEKNVSKTKNERKI
ncbi:MAG: peptide deformylase [Patescibacteria group bacterium]|nr:peptide deformylase [Patescibacteria group bacterium]